MLSSLYVRLEARLSLFLNIFGRVEWGCFVNVMVRDNRKFQWAFFCYSAANLHNPLRLLAMPCPRPSDGCTCEHFLTSINV